MEINLFIEHTVLKQGQTENDILNAFDLCIRKSIPTLVIPPTFVRFASGLITDQYVSLCTVIGFPLGFSTYSTKLYEIEDSKFNGAKEIDLVMDNSLIRSGNLKRFSDELSSFRRSCEGLILKIIVETSLLSREELEQVAKILVTNGIDFIKTSTGMIGKGADLDDVKFLKDKFGSEIKIKASGGIRTKEQVIGFIKAGADRIGTSSAKTILEN